MFLAFAGVLITGIGQLKAATDSYYLALPGITGDASVAGHLHDIAVTGFEYPGISGSAQSFYIEKVFDSASAQLLLASVSGTTISSGTFYCDAGGGGELEKTQHVFVMVFGDLMVDAWQSADMGTADPVPKEKVSFSFSSLSITTYPARAKGGGSPVTTLIYPPLHN